MAGYSTVGRHTDRQPTLTTQQTVRHRHTYTHRQTDKQQHIDTYTTYRDIHTHNTQRERQHTQTTQQ